MKTCAEANTEFYDRAAATSGGDPAKAVGWGSQASQMCRFQIVQRMLEEHLAAMDPAEVRLLDVGAGTGAFLDFLSVMSSPAGLWDAIGVDIVQSHDDHPRVFKGDVLDLEQKFDATVAIGTFAVDFDGRFGEVHRRVEHMWSLTRKVMVISMLSLWMPPEDLAHARACGCVADRPDDWLKWASRRGRGYGLRHDYLPNDFTFWVAR